jgi:hypothetical protein
LRRQCWLPGGALGEARFAVLRFNRAYFEVNDATWFGLRGGGRDVFAGLLPLSGLQVTVGVGALLGPPRSDFAEWVAQDYRNLGDFEGMHILKRGE